MMIWEKLGGESESSRRDSLDQMNTAVLLEVASVSPAPDVCCTSN